MKKILFLICFILFPVSVFCADYTVSTSTQTVDGDTYCGGSACTSSDTIIVDGGARNNLLFQDFNGDGVYITIKNKSTGDDVVITDNASVGYGVLSFYNCAWVDFRGDNNSGEAYGFLVNSSGSRSGGIFVYGQSHHLKISYVEANTTGNSNNGACTMQVQDPILGDEYTFTYIEIHHNYFHDSKYDQLYVGHNCPSGVCPDYSNDDHPHVGNISIHDNIFENSGTYGFNLKGNVSGPSEIYNNIITGTGVNAYWVNYPLSHEFFCGLKITWGSDGSVINIHDNWIEDTLGPGILIAQAYTSSQLNSTDGGLGATYNIYDNVLVNTGTGSDATFAHGIISHYHTFANVNVEDNVIIQSYGYGLYVTQSDCVMHGERNYIGDTESGESGIGQVGATLTEGTGADANIYQADVANLGFHKWSDDDDYSNDFLQIVSTSSVPSGTLNCTTDPRDITTTINTQFTANGRIGSADGESWAAMAGEMDSTDSTSHVDTESLACGDSYTRYVRLADYFRSSGLVSSGHESDLVTIDFSIDSGAPPDPAPGTVGRATGVVSQGVVLQ